MCCDEGAYQVYTKHERESINDAIYVVKTPSKQPDIVPK